MTYKVRVRTIKLGAEEAIVYLCKMERKHPTPVLRRLSPTHAVLERFIPVSWIPLSGMKVRSLVRLPTHSAFNWWSAQCAARMLLLSDELMWCCVVNTNRCLGLSMTSQTSLLCIMSSKLQNLSDFHWSNPLSWLIIAMHTAISTHHIILHSSLLSMHVGEMLNLRPGWLQWP